MNRYCTDCGSITLKESDSVFICENGHKNFLDPAAASVVYILDNDRVLFGYRSIEPHKGGLNVPGGFINIGESAEEAALREVHEEFDIDVTLTDFLGSYPTNYAHSNKPVLCLTFIAKYNGDVITPGDDMSGGQPVWRNINDLPDVTKLAWDWQVQAQVDLQEWWKNKDKKTTG